MSRLRMLLGAILFFVCSVAHGQSQSMSPNIFGDVNSGRTAIKSSAPFVGGYQLFLQTGQNSQTTNDGGNTCEQIRLLNSPTTDCTNLVVVEGGYYCNPQEVVCPNPFLVKRSFEYPANTCYPLTSNGLDYLVVQPGSMPKWDPLPLVVPSGATSYTRASVAVAAPPISLAQSGSESGGTLSAATYYYVVTTQTVGLGESGPSAEVSYTASGPTASVALTWAAPAYTGTLPAPLQPLTYRIYRGTSTGAEVYLTTVPAGTVGWTDTGAISIGSGSPPAARVWPQNGIVTVLASSQGRESTTSWQDKTASGSIASANVFVYTPLAIFAQPLGGDVIPNAVINGDSIGNGTADAAAGGYIARALTAAKNIGFTKITIGSNSAAFMNLPANQIHRGPLITGTVGISELGINEVSSPYATVTSNLLGSWLYLHRQGVQRIYQTTITPKVNVGTSVAYTIPSLETPQAGYGPAMLVTGTATSATINTLTDTSKTWTTNQFFPTGGGITCLVVSGRGAGQSASITANTATQLTISGSWAITPDSTSVYRIQDNRCLINDWLRAGAYTTVTGTGASTVYTASWAGIAGAVPCPLLNGIEEVADIIEGGRNTGVIAPHVYVTATASSATSTTLTVSGASWTTNQYAGAYCVTTSGTGSSPIQSNLIASNTSNTLTFGTPWSVTPDSTTGVQIVAPRVSDGVHLAPIGAADAAAGITISHITGSIP